MRNKLLAVLSASLILGLLLPQGVMARRQTLLGSLSVTRADGAPLVGEVTGVATISNPGFEKNINQQLPPYTIPIFVDQDESDDASPNPAGPRILDRRFDTTVILTNTTGAALNVDLTLRDAEGAVLGTAQTVTLPAHGTRAVALSGLVH